jgi:hypothetical protein
MKRNVSVVRLFVATRSSGPPASGKIIKEMPGSVASGTPYICNLTQQTRIVHVTNVHYNMLRPTFMLIIRKLHSLHKTESAPPLQPVDTITSINPLNAKLNRICHLLALIGGATIVVVSRLRVKLLIANSVEEYWKQNNISKLVAII